MYLRSQDGRETGAGLVPVARARGRVLATDATVGASDEDASRVLFDEIGDDADASPLSQARRCAADPAGEREREERTRRGEEDRRRRRARHEAACDGGEGGDGREPQRIRPHERGCALHGDARARHVRHIRPPGFRRWPSVTA
jgi:hypothetical protein